MTGAEYVGLALNTWRPAMTSTQIEIEIVGGASANYLRKFSRRRFANTEAAGRYMATVGAYLDEMGVRAAHPMVAYDVDGRDVTSDCWRRIEQL